MEGKAGRLSEPIVSRFPGTFDGRGHKISDLYISRVTEYVGLFGCVSGVLKDISMPDFTVTGYRHVGGLAGVNGGIVTNCDSGGSVTGEPFHWRARRTQQW
jgi:hypothetical protein